MGFGSEKLEVYRLSIMLSRLSVKGDSVSESSATCLIEPVAVDSDFDPKDEKPQQVAARNALTHVRAP
jgi:hypothetical protein